MIRNLVTRIGRAFEILGRAASRPLERRRARIHREAAAEYIALAELMAGRAELDPSARALRVLADEHTQRASKVLRSGGF